MAKAERLSIACAPVVQTATAVYVEGSPTPTPDDVRDCVLAWIRAHAEPPMRDRLQEHAGSGLFRVLVTTRHALPLPPMTFLRAAGMGDPEERRLDTARHLVFLDITDQNLAPFAGLWLREAACAAIAERWHGVVFDPAFPRIVPLEALRTGIAAEREIAVAEHVMVPTSVGEDGLLLATTSGMSRFGLPDLQVEGAPAHLARGAVALLTALAQRLVETVAAATEPPEAVEVDAVQTVGGEELARAHRRPAPSGEARVLLRFGHYPGDPETEMLEIAAPAGTGGETGEWLAETLERLAHRPSLLTQVGIEDPAVARGHQRAVRELAKARSRFAGGLRPGETLLVKHAFPTEDERHEYLWVAVDRWAAGRIRGRLASHPVARGDLREGQAVEIAEGDLFDWMIIEPDGRQVGGYTVIDEPAS